MPLWIGHCPVIKAYPAGREGRLCMMICEQYALLADAVDIRGSISHLAVTVKTAVVPAIIIGRDDEDVRFTLCKGRCT
jgi:hypothetical protein